MSRGCPKFCRHGKFNYLFQPSRFLEISYEFTGGDGVISGSEADVLSLPLGFPLLVVSYTLIGPEGGAVLTGRNISRSDRFTYQFCGRPGVHGAGP